MEFDLETFQREFEESYEEPETETDEIESDDVEENDTEEIPEDVEETNDEIPEDTETTEDSDEEEDLNLDRENLPDFAETEKKKQTKEENTAFAEMRRQNEALKQQASIVEEYAASHNMTVDQYIAAVRQQQEEQQAQEKGVPVEMLRQLNTTQSRLEQIEKQSATEKFYASVDKVKEKFGLDNDEVNNVFSYIGSQGLVNQSTGLPLVDFEFAYKAANFDSIQERTIKQAKQKDLAAKKQRQKKSAVSHTNASTTSNTDSSEMSDEEWAETAKRMGLQI